MAGCSPPMNSATMVISGSSSTSAGLVVSTSWGTEQVRALLRLRTSTFFTRTVM